MPSVLEEMRESWQARLLAATRYEPIGMVVLSVLAHNYDDAMPVLMRVTFPGFQSITAPFLCTAGRIAKTGAVMADMVNDDGSVSRNEVIFRNTTQMRSRFRKLADQLKLSDKDRKEMFAAAQRWVVCDYRLDPTMDPGDPDAKRLVH